MRIFKIELFVLGILILLFASKNLKLDFALLYFKDISTTLSNPNWQGSPYIIKQLRVRDRSFEDAKLSFNHSKWDPEKDILEHHPLFTTELKTHDGIFYRTGPEYELCLNLFEKKYKKLRNRLLSKEYEINASANISYNSLRNERDATVNHIIQYASQFNVYGLTSKQYRDQKIQQFVLLRMLELMNETLRPERQAEEFVKRQVALTYVWTTICIIPFQYPIDYKIPHFLDTRELRLSLPLQDQ